MRKAYKKLLIAAISLCVAGVLVFVIGMSVIGWDFYKLDTAEYTANSYVPEVEVSSFELDVESFPVIVRRGDAVSLDYYEASDSKVTVETVDGVLKVRERQSHNPFKSMFNIGRLKHKYVLTVVDGSAMTISGGGSVNVSFEGLHVSSLVIDTPNADVDFNSCGIETLLIKATNLNADIRGCEIAEIEMPNICNCSLNMYDCSGLSITADSTNLDIEVKNFNYDIIALSGVNIDFTAYAVNSKSITVAGTNTDVDLFGTTVDSLALRGVNLDAEIVVVGRAAEYGIFSDGRGLPQSRPGTTDKSITLSGVNNDVELRFSE